MDINPQDYKVIADTRECSRFVYDLSPFDVVRAKLDTGDYSVEGFENEITIERKEMNDLVQSITHNRDRFQREIDRMLSIPIRLILVECNMSDIVEHRYLSKTHPNAVMGTLAKYMAIGIPVAFASRREIAQDVTRRFLFQGIRQALKLRNPQRDLEEPPKV